MSEQIKKPSEEGHYVRALGGGRVLIRKGARAKCLADFYRSEHPLTGPEVVEQKKPDNKLSRIFKLKR